MLLVMASCRRTNVVAIQRVRCCETLDVAATQREALHSKLL